MKAFRMIKTIVTGFFLGIVLSGCVESQTITGAGGSFSAPLYEKWAELYKGKSGVTITYKATNSGDGLGQIIDRKVDFGASDKPFDKDTLDKHQLMQFPAVIGGVVPVVSLKGVKPGDLKLTGAVLADIYMGNILSWNDKAIVDLNPGLKLPDLLITVVHRHEDSGTTYLFTDYLSKESKVWKDKYGANGAIAWPAGVAGVGNEGVASYVDRVEGALGYVEFSYAQRKKLAYAQLKNQNGKFITPSVEAFQAAGASANWQSAANFQLILTNVKGEGVWPITGATFILVPRDSGNSQKTKDVLTFFDWAYENGDTAARDLGYMSMPKSVIDLVKKYWQEKSNRTKQEYMMK